MRRRGLQPTPPVPAPVAGEEVQPPPGGRSSRWALGIAVAVAVVAIAGAALAACTDETSPEQGADAAIYAEVLRQVNGPQDVEELPLLFVRPVNGHSIDLGVQAEVVKALDEVATVRFVDEEDEVVLVDEPLEPVRDDAVMVTVGAIARLGPRAEVVAERYVDRRHVTEHCVALRQVGELWESLDEDCRLPS